MAPPYRREASYFNFQCSLLTANCPFCIDLLVVTLQFSLGQDPSKTLGCDVLKFSVDRGCQMTVFSGKAETEDLLQVHKATGDFLPLFMIDGFYQAALVLSLF